MHNQQQALASHLAAAWVAGRHRLERLREDGADETGAVSVEYVLLAAGAAAAAIALAALILVKVQEAGEAIPTGV